MQGGKLDQYETFEAYQVATFLGEYAAFAVGEVITFKSALTILANRARFMMRKSTSAFNPVDYLL